MKVFLITEGGRDIGFGHVTRCLAIYEAFTEKGIDAEIIVNSDDSLRSVLIDKRHRVINWLKEERRLLKSINNADIVIVDSYLAEVGFYKKISKVARIPAFLDDYKRLNYPRGVVINVNIHAHDLNYPQKTNVSYLLGSRYVPLRKDFWNLPPKKIRKNIKVILVTFGGTDLRNMTLSLLDFLTKNFSHLFKNIVIGAGFKILKKIERLKDKKTNIIYSPDGYKMKKLMLESDIAISGAGQTIYELARVGLATLAIAVAGNQLHDVKKWEETGFLEYLGWWQDDQILDRLLVSLDKLNDFDSRFERLKIGRKLVDGKGANRIVDFLIGAKLS